MSYKFGLVSISFRGKSPEEIVLAVKNAGLSCVEWGSDIHAPKDNPEKLNHIVELQKKYNIECSSYGTYFRLGVNPVEELEEYINAAKVLGTDILRLWCGNKNSEDYTDDEREELFEQCREAAKIAEKHGAKLCMECHNNTYTNSKNSALELMNAVSSPNFLMFWQPNQLRSIEENIEYAEAISPYTKHIHAFYWEGLTHFSLNDGIEIWRKYLEKFDKDKTLLLEFMPDDKIESLPVEAEALKEIVRI